MDNEGLNLRTDEQLEAILYETSLWAVKGQQGQALCFAASLEHAIEKSTEYGVSGAVVVAVSRQPLDNLVVFPAQLDRLRTGLARANGWCRLPGRSRAVTDTARLRIEPALAT
jgi:hypothetical protein